MGKNKLKKFTITLYIQYHLLYLYRELSSTNHKIFAVSILAVSASILGGVYLHPFIFIPVIFLYLKTVEFLWRPRKQEEQPKFMVVNGVKINI